MQVEGSYGCSNFLKKTISIRLLFMTFIHLEEKCGGQRLLVFHHLTMFKREKKVGRASRLHLKMELSPGSHPRRD